MGPHLPLHLPQWPPRPTSAENANSAWQGSSIKSSIYREAQAETRSPHGGTTNVVDSACPSEQRGLHEVRHADADSVLDSPIFQGNCYEELDSDDSDVYASCEPCATAASTAPPAATATSFLQELEQRRQHNVGAGTAGQVDVDAAGAGKNTMFRCSRSNSNSDSLVEAYPPNTRAVTHAAAQALTNAAAPGTASANRPAPLRVRFSPSVMEALPRSTATSTITASDAGCGRDNFDDGGLRSAKAEAKAMAWTLAQAAEEEAAEEGGEEENGGKERRRGEGGEQGEEGCWGGGAFGLEENRVHSLPPASHANSCPYPVATPPPLRHAAAATSAAAAAAVAAAAARAPPASIPMTLLGKEAGRASPPENGSNDSQGRRGFVRQQNGIHTAWRRRPIDHSSIDTEGGVRGCGEGGGGGGGGGGGADGGGGSEGRGGRGRGGRGAGGVAIRTNSLPPPPQPPPPITTTTRRPTAMAHCCGGDGDGVDVVRGSSFSRTDSRRRCATGADKLIAPSAFCRKQQQQQGQQLQQQPTRLFLRRTGPALAPCSTNITAPPAPRLVAVAGAVGMRRVCTSAGYSGNTRPAPMLPCVGQYVPVNALRRGGEFRSSPAGERGDAKGEGSADRGGRGGGGGEGAAGRGRRWGGGGTGGRLTPPMHERAASAAVLSSTKTTAAKATTTVTDTRRLVTRLPQETFRVCRSSSATNHFVTDGNGGSGGRGRSCGGAGGGGGVENGRSVGRAPLSSLAARKNLDRVARASKMGTKSDPVTLYRQRRELEQTMKANAAARSRRRVVGEARGSDSCRPTGVVAGRERVGRSGAAAAVMVAGWR